MRKKRSVVHRRPRKWKGNSHLSAISSAEESRTPRSTSLVASDLEKKGDVQGRGKEREKESRYLPLAEKGGESDRVSHLLFFQKGRIFLRPSERKTFGLIGKRARVFVKKKEHSS